METIGFSTGSLAHADFRAALALLEGHAIGAVELSALRNAELGPLLDAIPHLDLTRYQHLSIHAPSAYRIDEECAIAAMLAPWAARGWTIVVHPDTIRNVRCWAPLGSRLSVENMDVRKRCGRTTNELRAIFRELPEASFCLDLAHARQIDPSMGEVARLIDAFGNRLSHLHLSELDARSRHMPMSRAAAQAYETVAHRIPMDVPIIIESEVGPAEIEAELEHCLRALGRDAALV